jgi:hypothetical protein
VSWDGLVLERDNPFWQTHFPPNGWGCHCKVRGLWPRDLQRLGKSGPDQAPEVNLVERTIGQRSALGPRTVRLPEGIDPGFEYAPGSARQRSAVPPHRPEPLIPGSTGGQGLPNRRPPDALPPARAVPAADLLPVGLPPQDYARAFLAPLGATLQEPAIVRDVIGERLAVGADLFKTAVGDWKVDKRDRGRFMPLLARALIDPDEIWTRIEWLYGQQRAVVRRRYIARFVVEGEDAPALIVFESGPDGWAGVTAFAGPDQSPDGWRVGVRLYRREAEKE